MVGLAIGAADAAGFYAILRAFFAAGRNSTLKTILILSEILKLAAIAVGLFLLCVMAHAPMAWLVGSALFSSFAGKMVSITLTSGLRR